MRPPFFIYSSFAFFNWVSLNSHSSVTRVFSRYVFHVLCQLAATSRTSLSVGWDEQSAVPTVVLFLYGVVNILFVDSAAMREQQDSLAANHELAMCLLCCLLLGRFVSSFLHASACAVNTSLQHYYN